VPVWNHAHRATRALAEAIADDISACFDDRFDDRLPRPVPVTVTEADAHHTYGGAGEPIARHVSVVLRVDRGHGYHLVPRAALSTILGDVVQLLGAGDDVIEGFGTVTGAHLVSLTDIRDGYVIRLHLDVPPIADGCEIRPVKRSSLPVGERIEPTPRPRLFAGLDLHRAYGFEDILSGVDLDDLEVTA
jgi:hypothetical protein